jgi:thiol-disulfide isomerase/thioredoxin
MSHVRGWSIGLLSAALVATALVPGLARGQASGQLRPGDGRAVPAIDGVDPVSGKRVSLAHWAGKPVVINVWGSWCHPCNKEAPQLARFAKQHRGVLLGLDVTDSKAGARAFYRRYRIAYPSIFDPKAKLFIGKLGGKGVPTTLFLDRRHRIVAEVLGKSTVSQLQRGLSRASR